MTQVLYCRDMCSVMLSYNYVERELRLNEITIMFELE